MEATQTFGQAATAALTAAAASQEQSTKGSNTSTGSKAELERRRYFLTMFRRWEALFKRADRGDEMADKWLIAEYYKSLGHLSTSGLEALTEQLKRRCTFFPTIRECLAIIEVPQLSGEWSNPFINRPAAFYHNGSAIALADQRRHTIAIGGANG